MFEVKLVFDDRDVKGWAVYRDGEMFGTRYHDDEFGALAELARYDTWAAREWEKVLLAV